ncbi:parthenolide synthase-like [Rutidosis leptorrhynchoides]|uniref:parthenolide synthase-like n=1 Tax=Rutidosis leptorrhynchoides TaxID=125765 RepID=UPI003A992E54
MKIYSSWLLISTFILCIFFYTLRSTKRLIMASPYNLPPNPPKLPIIGNLHQILTKPRHQALWQLSKSYGPIMQFYIGSKPFLIISSPAMSKQIFKTHDHVFCSRPFSKATKRLTYNYVDISFSPHSDHRRDMRKILVSEFLGPKRSRLFNHVLVKETETMIHFISSHPSNIAVNLNDLFLATIKQVICKMAFGKNYRQQPVNGPSWEVMIDETQEMFSGSLGDYFPWLGSFIDRFSGFDGKLETCFANIDAYIETILDDHYNQNIDELSDDDKDFVHAIIELSLKENASAYRLTKDEIKALILDVLMGGVDTTVTTMVWAMSEIARNTRVMRKLQSEIRTKTERKQDSGELDITKMRYLKMVVKETFRMHPPAPLLLPHESLSHCQVGGYDVLPNTSALVNVWGIGRDPNIWGNNANEFYPERFENFDVEFELMPFGGGRRSCPAINTAPTTMEFVIANLLYSFDWKLPNEAKSDDLNMEEEGSLVLRKKFPLCLVPINYNEEDY